MTTLDLLEKRTNGEDIQDLTKSLRIIKAPKKVCGYTGLQFQWHRKRVQKFPEWQKQNPSDLHLEVFISTPPLLLKYARSLLEKSVAYFYGINDVLDSHNFTTLALRDETDKILGLAIFRRSKWCPKDQCDAPLFYVMPDLHDIDNSQGLLQILEIIVKRLGMTKMTVSSSTDNISPELFLSRGYKTAFTSCVDNNLRGHEKYLPAYKLR